MTGSAGSECGWQEFFSHPHFLRFSSAILTPERTALEVSAIQKWLGLKPGSSILDLGCGYGRLAVPLARSGCRLTGLDGSAALLERAAAYASETGAEIALIHHDMRDTAAVPGGFDAVINMSTAFGYDDSPQGDLAALASVRAALKPGGLFLIDLENRDAKIRTARSASFEMAGATIECRREFDALTGRWRETMSWTENGIADSAVFSVRLYSATEVIDMFGQAGLEFVSAWGWFDGTDYDIDSHRMILLARRPADSAARGYRTTAMAVAFSG
jgi:SAM-dependent methyltransferase